MIALCSTCHHPLDRHTRGSSQSMGCPPNLYLFAGEEKIHSLVGSVGLVRATARALATARNEPVRWVRLGDRVPYLWESN